MSHMNARFFVKMRQPKNDIPCRECDISRFVFAGAFFRRDFLTMIQVDVTSGEKRGSFRNCAAKKDFTQKNVEAAFFTLD